MHVPGAYRNAATCMCRRVGLTLINVFYAMQWGVFVLFACCVFLMTLSVYLFFPETKGVPIEDCPYVFKHHWYWKK